MTETERNSVNWPVVLVGGTIVVVAAVVAVQKIPELAPVRQGVRETKELVAHLPERMESLLDNVRGRITRARAAFYTSRAEAERALTAQFEEAKQRGSVPPV